MTNEAHFLLNYTFSHFLVKMLYLKERIVMGSFVHLWLCQLITLD